MFFFEDIRKELWPASRIERIGPEREIEARYGKQTVRTVFLSGGDEVTATVREIDDLRRTAAPTCPANGEVIIDYRPSDNSVTKTPIIGWARTHDEGVVPITYQGLNDERSENLAVLFTSGQVMMYDCQYDTLDDFIREKQAQRSDA